jgi:hypothetical protein
MESMPCRSADAAQNSRLSFTGGPYESSYAIKRMVMQGRQGGQASMTVLLGLPMMIQAVAQVTETQRFLP